MVMGRFRGRCRISGSKYRLNAIFLQPEFQKCWDVIQI